MVQARHNLEGSFYGGKFHPYRSSKDYAHFMAGEQVPLFSRGKDPFGRKGSKRGSSRRATPTHMSLAEIKKTPDSELSLSDFVRGAGGINRPRKGEDGYGLLQEGSVNYNWLIRPESERDRHHVSEYVMDLANDAGFRDAYGEKFTHPESFIGAVIDDRNATKRSEKYWSINKEYDVDAEAEAEAAYYATRSNPEFFTKEDIERARRAVPIPVDALKGLEVREKASGRKGVITQSLMDTKGVRWLEVQYTRPKRLEAVMLRDVVLMNPASLRPIKGVLGSANVNQILASPRAYHQLAQAYDLARRAGDEKRMTALEVLSLMLKEHDAEQFRRALAMRRNGAAFYNSLNEIKRANRRAGQGFFEPSAVRASRMLIFPEVYGGRFFITSETPDRQTARRFTLRRADGAGVVYTVGRQRGHITKEGAERAAQVLSSREVSNPAGVLAIMPHIVPHFVEGVAAGAGSAIAGHYLWQKAVAKHAAKQTKKETRTNGGGAPASINELSQMFQGDVSGDAEDLLVSRHHAGAKLARLGRLKAIRLHEPARGCAARIERNPFHVCQRCGVQFNPRTSVAAMNAKKKIVLCGTGVKFRKPRALKNPLAVEMRGRIEFIIYETAKAHIGGGEPFNYGHHFAELTGNVGDMPELGLDVDGMPLVMGGAYDITEDGIEN